jgi:hypothetical protein
MNVHEHVDIHWLLLPAWPLKPLPEFFSRPRMVTEAGTRAIYQSRALKLILGNQRMDNKDGSCGNRG